MNNRLHTSTRPAPEFLEHLRDARLAADLSQRDASALLGWGMDRLRAYEDGVRAIHPRLAAEWAAAFGLTITTVPSARHCVVCRCIDDEACEGGCAWVTHGSLETNLCTSCAWAIARDAVASGLYQPEHKPPSSAEGT